MIRTDSRLAFVVCASLTIAAGSCGQTSSSPVIAASEWMGVWVLTIDGVRGPEKQALSVGVAPDSVPERGKAVATLNIGGGREIKITDVAIRGNDLVLKYQHTGPRGDVDAVSTLSMGPDGTVTLRTEQGQGTRSGTGRLVVPAALLDELFYERDETEMMKKAQAAGLAVRRSSFGDGGSFYVVTEPATEMILLTRSITP